jgi:phage tail-like protein
MTGKRAVRPPIGRPHANSNFLVDLGSGDPNSFSAGFCEVVFPEFRIDGPELVATSGAEQAADRENSSTRGLLILRRGVTGALDLYEWWNKARTGKAPKGRTVTITLLAEDLSHVFTWRFRQVRPVRLSYSPLNAMDGGVLMESIELAFEAVEMREGGHAH